MLRRFGVDFAQGMHLGAPRPIDEAIPMPAQLDVSEARLLSNPG